MDTNAKASVIAAAIGGICIFLAAVIGLFTPVVSRLSERLLAPTETPLPTNTWTPAPTWTPEVPPTETASPSVVFLVYNNFENHQDLYVDGQLEAAVDSGSYATFRTLRGSHLLTSCARGKNPQVNPESCIGRTYVIQEDPFFWEMTGNKTPQGDATFIVRDISAVDVDFFIDDKLTTSVDRATYVVLKVPVGVRTFQACPRGLNPVANPTNCGPLSRFDVENAIQSWTIHD